MVSVKLVLDLVNFISNKETAGNTMKIDEYNTLIKAVNIDMLNLRYGIPAQYRPGQPLPQQSYEVTKKMIDDLRYLEVRTGVETNPIVIDQWGRSNIPSDYLHLSSARHNRVVNNNCDTKDVVPTDIELLTDAQIGDRLGNSITMPTLEDPCMVIYSTYFQFYPKELRMVELTYLRFPDTPYYAYTIDEETDEYIYDATHSVDFEFPDDCLIDIVRFVASYVGINLKESVVIQYVEQIKDEGKQ